MLASRRRSVAYQPIVAPVLLGKRYAGRPVYFSDVIVPAASATASFADLRGGVFAVNERASHSGYGVVRYELLRRGETHGFFGRVVESGAHRHSIGMVAAGEADGAAVDSQVLAVELRDRPGLRERLRVVESLGPSTIQPLVAAVHVPAGVVDAVRRAFLDAPLDAALREALDRGLIERFVPIAEADYDDIRRMIRACEEARFLVLK